ncbi:MAG: acyltransferase family protein, partial [Beijerinckiaceae bacterium]
TLRYELICYAGLLAYGVAGGCRRPALALAGAGLVALALVVLGLIGPMSKGQETALRLPLVFAAGSLLYLYRDRVRLSLGIVAALAFALPVAALVLPSLYKPLLFIGTAYLMIFAAIAPGLSHPKFEPPGDISYGVYLYGWPVQQALQSLFPALSGWAMLGPALLVTCLVATISWLLVEKPALGLKAKFMPQRAASP